MTTVAILAFVLALVMLLTVIATVIALSKFWRAEVSDLRAEHSRLLTQREHYIAELHNRLAANSWQEFTALQQNTPNAQDKTVASQKAAAGAGDGEWKLLGDTEASEPAAFDDVGWGETVDDSIEAQWLARGVDMEGPTVGGA